MRLPSRRACRPRRASASASGAAPSTRSTRIVSVSSVSPETAPVRSSASGVEDDDGVAGPLDVAHQVRRDDDADAELAADAPDQLEHVAAAHRVEPGGRLVEERQHRIVNERLGQLHPLLHPGRVGPHGPVALLEQPDVAEDVGRAQAGGRAREPADLRQVGEKLGSRDRTWEAVVLGCVPDPGAVLGRASRVGAEHFDRAGVGVDQAHEQLQRRRLAGAVGAEQPCDPGLDLEADVVQRPDGAVRLRQTPSVDESHARGAYRGPMDPTPALAVARRRHGGKRRGREADAFRVSRQGSAGADSSVAGKCGAAAKRSLKGFESCPRLTLAPKLCGREADAFRVYARRESARAIRFAQRDAAG